MRYVVKNEEEGSLKDAALFLSEKTGLSLLASTVCVNRGISTPEQVDLFLNPKLETLTHPFRIQNLEKAAIRIFESQNKQNPEKLRVFTDYDVDGTTGAALLSWFFRDLSFQFDVVQPDRFRDGYGLNVGAVEKAKEDGVGILITVDCGVTNFAAAKRARDLGIELIIVDHHQIDPIHGVPDAFAVIDPQQESDLSGLRQLCGCALGFYLCMGIRIKAREAGFFKARSISEPKMRNLLDLVVIATAADMVPLIGDNRTLVRHGLQVLRDTDKPGLRELMRVAGIEVKSVSASNLGFGLGPRINASGRMGSAETAYRVLTTRDPDEGRRLAEQLEAMNQERAETQNLIWDQVRERVSAGIEKGEHPFGVVVASGEWHEGVVGIVASRVTEYFKKPAVVLSIREDGIAKGSVRSYGGYNVLEALHLSNSRLLGYGGHKFAAGLSLKEEDFEEFSKSFNESLSMLIPRESDDRLKLECRVKLSDLDLKGLSELESLAPFGPGNPEPLIGVEARIEEQMVLKGRHLKLKLQAESVKRFEGIWFNAAERLEFTELVEVSAQLKKSCFFAGIPEINRFMGRVTPTLRIKEARLVT
ncbi:MAG: single-stranded-DNA-specific exonuclease RecJ [Bdellovibrionales bacterium]|nr:single-stranded-DNA-specific exonuclease RecJ [Bdellovibrionales bacterium]